MEAFIPSYEGICEVEGRGRNVEGTVVRVLNCMRRTLVQVYISKRVELYKKKKEKGVL